MAGESSPGAGSAADPARAVAQALAAEPGPRRAWVALSGGADSTALLIAARRALDAGVLASLEAVHVHHGLQPEADGWAAHCRVLCATLEVPLTVRTVAVTAAGEGPEAAAREARHAALAAVLPAGGLLLTGHHRGDQAETLLLQLLRGAGPAGLAGMPAARAFGRGRLLRPLLDCPRERLEAYCREAGLDWVEDPSNASTAFDRNYLRAEILPRLRDRWPGAETTLARAAALQGEAAELLDERAAQDLADASGSRPGRLSLAPFLELAPARQRNLLRAAIARQGLPLPPRDRLEGFRRQLATAATDRLPGLQWPGGELRRWRDEIHVLAPRPAHDPGLRLEWRPEQGPLAIPGVGRLGAELRRGEGIPAVFAGRRLVVGFRRGGERCRPAAQGPSRAVKKLLQESGVPPWERDRLPLVFAGETLLAVVGLCHCRPVRATEEGVVFRLEPGG